MLTMPEDAEERCKVYGPYKRQIDRYMKDTETVVILNAKNRLDYWT